MRYPPFCASVTRVKRKHAVAGGRCTPANLNAPQGIAPLIYGKTVSQKDVDVSSREALNRQFSVKSAWGFT